MKKLTHSPRSAMRAMAAALTLGGMVFPVSGGNDELGTEGITLHVEIIGAIKNEHGFYKILQDADKQYLHQLSRQPQPRNEWVFKKYFFVEKDPAGGWMEKRGNAVQTEYCGLYMEEFRADMEFFAVPGDPIEGGGVKVVSTPAVQINHIVTEY